MSSCFLVIVHASLKNMVSRQTRLKFLIPKTASNMTWQKNSWLPQFLEFRPEILHAYFWMHMQSNNDEKKYRFFDPFTVDAPLNELFDKYRLLNFRRLFSYTRGYQVWMIVILNLDHNGYLRDGWNRLHLTLHCWSRHLAWDEEYVPANVSSNKRCSWSSQR